MTVSRLRPYATTVFAEMSALATRIGAVNLGQGFPDEDGPPKMLQAAQDAIAGGVNQYPPGPGSAPLRRAIAAQRRRHFGVDYDPETEVLVTVGATEAIAAAVLGLVEPGSEVLLIEPFYDSYSPVVAMAGAHRVTVPLVPDGRGFALDADALRRAVTPRTRALIINSPHNPTGAVLSATELAAIAEIAVAANLVVITDEVYEHLVFDHARHLPLAGFDGMAERTITISSSTSALAASSSIACGCVLTSRSTIRFPRCSRSRSSDGIVRPPGRRTRTTSAPRSASTIPTCGPGPIPPSSMTFTPARGPPVVTATIDPSSLSTPGCATPRWPCRSSL